MNQSHTSKIIDDDNPRLNFEEVLALVKYKKSRVSEWIADGTFPRPMFRPGKRRLRFWPTSIIVAWQNQDLATIEAWNKDGWRRANAFGDIKDDNQLTLEFKADDLVSIVSINSSVWNKLSEREQKHIIESHSMMTTGIQYCLENHPDGLEGFLEEGGRRYERLKKFRQNKMVRCTT